MKVTNKTKKSLMISVIILLAIVILYQIYNPKIVKVNETIEVPFPVEVPVQIPVEKEYRSPPIKKYKPGHVQQMGVLVGNDEETLPLYGKEVRGRQDRYHYYTTTPGDQIYPLPCLLYTSPSPRDP